MPIRLCLIALLGCSVFSGCGRIPRGLIYTDYIEPFCQNARGKELGEQTVSGATKGVEIPLTRLNLSAEWNSRAIGDVAKQNGITTIYGCDIRREYYVLGIWRKDELLVYGN